jgi:hypothetical protein
MIKNACVQKIMIYTLLLGLMTAKCVTLVGSEATMFMHRFNALITIDMT